MANLIQNNSKLIEQQKSQISQTDQIQNPSKSPQNDSDKNRNPKTVRIIKDHSGFGFNVRGQISGEFLEHLPRTEYGIWSNHTK